MHMCIPEKIYSWSEKREEKFQSKGIKMAEIIIPEEILVN
jgi:hypothetical protein